jgi:NarL family two-component system sensor histidine kinase YdfH
VPGTLLSRAATRPLAAAAIAFVAVGFGWVTFHVAAWRSPALLGVLAALSIAQAVLHAFLPYASRTAARFAVFAAAQSALAIGFGAASGSGSWMAQLLLLPLAEAVAVLPSLRAQIAAGVGAAVLGVAAPILVFGAEVAPPALIHSGPFAFAVVVFGALYQWQARARDEAQAALAALDAAHRRLAEYAERVELLTVAAERQRLARELHDTLAQGLVGIVLQLEALDAHLSKGDGAKALSILQQARSRARGALSNARTAIAGLRHGDVPWLAEAIREEAACFSEATGIPCTLSIAEPLALPAEVSRQALGCLTEGLANVARHARATRASISVTSGGGEMVVELSDDGVGFDVAFAERRAGHYGLLGLRERARLAGGRLEIASAPGGGTKLRLALPVSPGGISA